MALKKNSGVDYLVSFLVVIFISVPSFIFAAVLQYFLAYKLGWFPIIYNATAVGSAKYLSMILPITALSFSPIARVARYLRGELIENLSSEYMLLARTKGLTRLQATVRHSMRNSLVPLAEHHHSHVYQHSHRVPGGGADFLRSRRRRAAGEVHQL